MARWIDLVLAHRWVVVVLWLVLAGAGGAPAGRTVDASERAVPRWLGRLERTDRPGAHRAGRPLARRPG